MARIPSRPSSATCSGSSATRRPSRCAPPRVGSRTSASPASAAARTPSACFSRFIGETDTRLIGVEAAGEGLKARHAAALAGGTPGVLHGSRSYLLQDEDGQVTEAHSISAGLDYPGVGPQLSALFEAGRLELLSATDEEAIEGVRLLTRTEGILPALEPAHAIHALIDLLRGRGVAAAGSDDIILLGLSGRGDKDIAAIEARLMAGMVEAGPL